MGKKGVSMSRTEVQALIAKNPKLLPGGLTRALAQNGPPAGLCDQKGSSVAESAPRNGKRRKQMNRTETEFSLMLERDKYEGRIRHWGYEEITLRWGDIDPIAYTPDFTVIELDGRHTFIETKNKQIWKSDLQKFKAARNQFQHYEFRLWQKSKEGWTRIY